LGKKRRKLSAHKALIDVLMADEKELVRFLNDILGTKHNPETAEVKFLSAVLKIEAKLGESGKIPIDDTLRYPDFLFSVDGIMYGVEVQTKYDKIMLYRLLEYELLTLLNYVPKESEYEIELPLPQKVLIQLEKRANIPDYYSMTFINTVTGEKLLQKIPIIKLWEHKTEDLANSDKKLLLPFKIVEYKKRLSRNGKSEKLARNLAKDSWIIHELMTNLLNDAKLSWDIHSKMQKSQHDIMAVYLNEYITADNPARKEVEDMLSNLIKLEIVEIEKPPSLFEMVVAERVEKFKREAEEAKKREAESKKLLAKANEREAEANEREAKAKEREALLKAELDALKERLTY